MPRSLITHSKVGSPSIVAHITAMKYEVCLQSSLLSPGIHVETHGSSTNSSTDVKVDD